MEIRMSCVSCYFFWGKPVEAEVEENVGDGEERLYMSDELKNGSCED